MITPKVLILRTAGTNCDYETQYAFEKAGAKVDVVHINILLTNKKLLTEYQILTLPGGFTYGDDVSAGKILFFSSTRLGSMLPQAVSVS